MSHRLLIVDDSRTCRIQMRRALQIAGYDPNSVTDAGNGIEALAALGTGNFSALITDIHMPAMDGVELVRRVRAHRSFSALSIVVVSSENTEERKSEMQRLGADCVLPKPFSPESLKAALTKLLNKA